MNIENKKLLIFDIDGTLCDINKPISNELVNTLQILSKQHQIVLASGKPFGYIAGFIRQLNLYNCFVIGENGATLMYSPFFPPKRYHKINVSKNVKDLFSRIRHLYSEKFGDHIWFQPNDVNITVFPIDSKEIQNIHYFAKQFQNDEINIYYHKDSVDFTPHGFDKGTAVEILLKTLNIGNEDLYVFGDGNNDLPMLIKTKNSFLINSTLDNYKPKQYFRDYTELNDYLKSQFHSKP